MSQQRLREQLQTQLDDLKAKGLYKRERQLQGPQGSAIRVADHEVVNFREQLPRPRQSSRHRRRRRQRLENARLWHGVGPLHLRHPGNPQAIRESIARFLGKDDAILYSSCWDANGGLFETILGEQDAIISDELNHASIIDGVRLCKANRFRYKNCDLADLALPARSESRPFPHDRHGRRLLDGRLARPAARYLHPGRQVRRPGHGGRQPRHRHPRPRRTRHAEALGCLERIDILTSTLGKTLGGAAGGFTAGSQELVDYLRQRSRPYLFSNAVPPPIIHAASKALELVSESSDLRDRLHGNARTLRAGLEKAGFKIKPGQHPILPVMLGDAALATKMADKLLEKGIYVIGFSFPVVPQGLARIRIQLSAAHTPDQLQRAVQAFTEVGRALGVIA